MGRFATRLWAVLVVVGLTSMLLAAGHHQYAFWFASDTTVLGFVRLGLILLAIGWAALFLDAWRIGQPLSLTLPHRRTVVGLNGVLCFSVAGTLLFGAHLVGVQRDFILTMFSGDTVTGQHDGRYNVLLVGGDSGASHPGAADRLDDRRQRRRRHRQDGADRPAAEHDQLPVRGGSVMHQAWPHGFDCGYPNCELNGIRRGLVTTPSCSRA